MSQEKAQLIAPQGHFTVPGLNVAGVVTASSFSGNCTGTASSLTQGSNVVVGVMTASSFAGDVFGNAAGLSTTTAGLKLGIVTATSFAGNFTGIGSGLTGTPNIVAGLVTATQFVGNTPGLAAGISAGKNLAAGIVTATTFYGDGSNLTGAGSTAFIRQNVTVTSNATTIDLNDGNIIYYSQDEVADTTISIANTSTADDITIIRNLAPYSNSWDDSISTASVDFDSGEYLTQTTDAVLRNWFDQAFTVEYWIKADSFASTDSGSGNALGASTLGSNSNFTWSFGPNQLGQVRFAWWNGSSDSAILPNQNLSTGTWYHLAFVHDGSYNCKIFIDGELQTLTANGGVTSYAITNGTADGGTFNIGKVQTANFDGKISNVRITHQALYSSSFTPPSAALTTTSQGATASNVKLLCCQSTTDDTAATVTPNTISANGTPTPASDTITQSGSISVSNYTITWPSSITWNGGSAPTLADANSYSKTGQVFNLVTSDGGSTWYGYEEVNNTNAARYQLWALGYNNSGPLGQNNETDYSSPVQVPGTWLKGVRNSAGSNENGAINSDGELWMWGDNAYGALGQNSTSTADYSSPIQVGTETTWSQISVGPANWCLASKTDGTLWSWGNSSYGILGLNSNNRRSSPTQIPGTTWSTGRGKIHAGHYMAAAVKTDGTLWTWGSNVNTGQLGQNTGHPSGERSSPVQVGSDTNWVNVYAGYRTVMGIKSDSTMWTWGLNLNGVLGQGNNVKYSSPAQIPGTTWSTISASRGTMSGALKTDGTLWMWGYNPSGNLGQNNRTNYSSPKQVPGTTWTGNILMSSTTGACAKTDGTLWIWGEAETGNLGQNDTTRRSSPVQIPGTNWNTEFNSSVNGNKWMILSERT